MPSVLKKLGVHGVNIPAKAPVVVTPADFSVGNIIGFFERQFAVAFQVYSIDQQRAIFGDDVNSSWYGFEEASLFWQNLSGQDGSLVIKSHVGYNGSVIDAIVASASVTDQNGLASLMTLANEMKTKMNAHAADAAQHTTHIDNTNFPITTPNAQDLSTLLTLINVLITKYSAHEADAALASAWVFHKAQETGTHALASQTAVYTMADAVTMLTDMRTKYNAHDADATAHGVGSSHQLVSAAPSSTPVATLQIQPAYQGNLEYGTSGNRTAYLIAAGIRYSTTLASNVAAADTSALVTSVIGIKIGDIVTFNASGGTAAIAQVKVTNIDESLNKIFWSGAFSGGATTGVAGDTVAVPGFTIRTFRKSISGIQVEVETQLGTQWCTMEPEVTQYYAPNVHSQNQYITVTDLADAGTLLATNPTNNAGGLPIYLTGGAAGTTPSTSAHWAADLTALNNFPCRFISIVESTDQTIQKSVETYCKARDDTPLSIPVIAENQTESQLITIGSAYQRSDDVMQVNVADWVSITDPFNNAPNAPVRHVPNAGAVQGAVICAIQELGIHYIPSVDVISLKGIQGIDNSNLGTLGDTDRTLLAQYGINIIQFIPGSGYRIRNFFTPSVTTAYLFANGLYMRNYIKISAQSSLSSKENYPNTLARITENKNAILNFLYKLWFNGSTGNVPVGETFGQSIDPTTGNPTTPDQHFMVQADAINNPQANINLGQQTLTLYFTYPTPAGNIDIQVGIMLR
jgi:hypothetical protein